MYTKERFGKDLKQRVLKKERIESIGYWAHSVYLDWPDSDDLVFYNYYYT